MEYVGRTPKEAIECAKKWLAIEHTNRPDLQGGTFFAKENPRNHPMRRFTAGYVKGTYEDRVKINCNDVDGVLVIKSDLQITSWRAWD